MGGGTGPALATSVMYEEKRQIPLSF